MKQFIKNVWLEEHMVTIAVAASEGSEVRSFVTIGNTPNRFVCLLIARMFGLVKTTLQGIV